MRRILAGVYTYKPLKIMALLIAVAIATTAVGAYAATRSADTINACSTKQTGQLRLNTGTGCSATEQAVQWNQTGPPGPQGPPGNSDSTVRHISGFMFNPTTVTTPLLSAKGEFGKLSLTCGTDAQGGNGTITYTSESDALQDSIGFTASNAPSSPTFVQVTPGNHATFTWGNTQGNNVSFEMLIESLMHQPASPPPSLTEIHGFVREFAQFGGCAYYVFVDTSDVASPTTLSP
jgi:hypothetical protein